MVNENTLEMFSHPHSCAPTPGVCPQILALGKVTGIFFREKGDLKARISDALFEADVFCLRITLSCHHGTYLAGH